jgi:DNA-binding CsgD family transcriptional regulator
VWGQFAYCGDAMAKKGESGTGKSRMGDMSALVRTARSMTIAANGEGVDRRRRLVAMFCTMLGEQALNGDAKQAPASVSPVISMGEPLSRRERQTLDLLLTGNAEKQIAAQLSISRHTVHVYVKSLYKRFGVNSRSELLAKWVRV